jgi:hypothetical protein
LSFRWKDFVEFLQKAMLKGAPSTTIPLSRSVGNRQQQLVKRNSSNLMSSIQTQTNTGKNMQNSLLDIGKGYRTQHPTHRGGVDYNNRLLIGEG